MKNHPKKRVEIAIENGATLARNPIEDYEENLSAWERVADRVAKGVGMAPVFFGACLLIVVWFVSGPYFGFSDTWQLVINTSTTIVTFLVVFLLQNSANRADAKRNAQAVHHYELALKNELETQKIFEKLCGIEKALAAQAKGGGGSRRR